MVMGRLVHLSHNDDHLPAGGPKALDAETELCIWLLICPAVYQCRRSVFNAVVTVEFSHHSLLVSPAGLGARGYPPPPFNQLQPPRVVGEPSVCADQTGGARSTGFQDPA